VSGGLFALLERLHGHLGVLALALLLHPVITLRRRGLTLWGRRTADLAAAMLAATFAGGWWLYPSYRESVKPALLADLPGIALRFESKEHLALFAAVLAIAGAAALRGKGPALRLAWWLLLSGWVCGVLAAALGVVVAAYGAPAW
jgi:hypothetical protein